MKILKIYFLLLLCNNTNLLIETGKNQVLDPDLHKMDADQRPGIEDQPTIDFSSG